MRVRFQADADLDARIIRGLKRQQPEIDIQTAAEAGLQGLADPDVLRVAGDSGRILVTHDRSTMPSHFAQFIAGRTSAGVIVVPKNISLGIAVEELLLIWAASQAEEWHNRMVWIPM